MRLSALINPGNFRAYFDLYIQKLITSRRTSSARWWLHDVNRNRLLIGKVLGRTELTGPFLRHSRLIAGRVTQLDVIRYLRKAVFGTVTSVAVLCLVSRISRAYE